MATLQELEIRLNAVDSERAALLTMIADMKAAAQRAELDEIVAKIVLHEIPLSAIVTALRAVGGSPDEAPPKVYKHKVGQPKYKDPNSNATWTGRGKAPAWLAGKDRDQFLIRGKVVPPTA